MYLPTYNFFSKASGLEPLYNILIDYAYLLKYEDNEVHSKTIH